jgi:Sec-independent protein secretion pathway component TatC
VLILAAFPTLVIQIMLTLMLICLCIQTIFMARRVTKKENELIELAAQAEKIKE